MSEPTIALTDNTPAEYVPFLAVPECYGKENSNMMRERMLTAFQHTFGVGKSAISTKFREKVKEVFDAEQPKLRCSIARAIFEGRIPGVPKPLHYIPPSWEYRIKYALALLDMFETIGALYVESKIEELDPTLKGQADVVRESLGGLKVPRLLEEVTKTETKPTKKVSKKERRKNGVAKAKSTKKRRARVV